MRKLPENLQTSLQSGVTTLSRCWRLTRRDGVVMGFTDHDRALTFEGVVYEAASGLNAGAVERSTGLSVDTHSVAGALQSDAIAEDDIRRGLYDGAEMQLWLVDWQDVAVRILLSTGRIGDIQRGEGGFEAEIVGMAEELGQPIGRSYQHRCDLRLGSTACGVATSDPAFRGTGVVTHVMSSARIAVSGLQEFEGGWFSEGAFAWNSGANAPASGQVKLHRLAGDEAVLELWNAPALQIAVGDAFEVVAGCDKRAETCRDKFANFLNFRGFPHMPGDDFASGYPSGGGHDGGSLLGG